MSNKTMLFLKAVATSFYAGKMRKNETLSLEPARSPVTISEQQCCDRARMAVHLHQNEPVDVMRYLSAEEKAFIQHLKEAFQLNEDDLNLFHLIGYARQANERELSLNTNLKRYELPQPDFSPGCLSLLMECVKPTLESSRGYYAAMVHLKRHPVPMAWRTDENTDA
ncbi:MAG: hypothetical protein Q8N54_07895 [Sulfurimicrobium sp.]|jgi:hypothetical protein|nr:hypothetical protein [Sulfurimicrobium sp.]MDO9191199.1 hypothetical protein [Sulfurimicrobium sp.]MDP1705770.1 hypothetical protein [Sulfurimicrobium sp.]MDP2198157.1 hypothetical protein [Sulfurimicrobium sp.]MDP2962669.1 hypothetical protein [Sulfurimicrobium sp.]